MKKYRMSKLLTNLSLLIDVDPNMKVLRAESCSYYDTTSDLECALCINTMQH